MNAIIKIIRRLGYNLVKYADPTSSSKKIIALHPEINNGTSIISKEKASEALLSVGRKIGVPSFTYYIRPHKSSVAMEHLENLWWNTHSNLIEKVWGFSEETNNCYRGAYVSKAAAFFSQNVNKAIVLDLGCGSGWFGRMIADKDIEYHGMDFSSAQIEIANHKKQASPNKTHLNYYCLTDFKKAGNIESINAIVIHAFLHHLYWEELHQLFSDLVKTLPDGCKFFIVEPMYPGKMNKQTNCLQTGDSDLVGAYHTKLNTIKNSLIDQNIYDTKTESELMTLGMESNRNSFFLSPKEVPFELNEFKTFLSNYVQIENTSLCGILNLETAQFIDKIKSPEIRKHCSDLLFPYVNALDQFLIANGYFEANPHNYQFMAFECTLKKS